MRSRRSQGEGGASDAEGLTIQLHGEFLSTLINRIEPQTQSTPREQKLNLKSLFSCLCASRVNGLLLNESGEVVHGAWDRQLPVRPRSMRLGATPLSQAKRRSGKPR